MIKRKPSASLPLPMAFAFMLFIQAIQIHS